jgi:hypothetical protein
MNDTVQQWLDDRAWPPGMLACGLRQPDGKFVCRSFEKSCPVEKMGKILGQVEGLRATLSADKLSPCWSAWEFEQGQIRLVERPDGWLLGLVIRAGPKAAPGLDRLSKEFLSLELGK